MHDFDDGKGPTPAHQHLNGGGWVADTATVAATAYVGPYARVYGTARVYGYALVCDYARVYDNAWVSGTAEVYGNARVYGYARVFDDAQVYGYAEVCGEAEVGGEAQVGGGGEQVTLPLPGATPDVIPTVNEVLARSLHTCARCNMFEVGYGVQGLSGADECTCCAICSSTQEDCDHCSRCESRARNCTCCPICSSTQEDCDHCSRCECPSADCECIRCARCGDISDDICSDCDWGDCCGHSPGCDNADISTSAGAPWTDGKGRLIGLEVEYSSAEDNSPLISFANRWRAGNHADGSCGREIVTAPIAGTHIPACVRDMARAFSAADAGANEKCGVHVHVDARDLSWEDMYRLLHVYAKVEPLLYVLAGQHRISNGYCKPTGEDYAEALTELDRKNAVLRVAYSEQGYTHIRDARRFVKEHKPGKKHAGRYKGLNICPWLVGRRQPTFKRGEWVRKADGTDQCVKRSVRAPVAPDCTVEFRLHRNTLEGTRLTGWATLLAQLVSWCAAASHKEAMLLPRSPLRALCAIAPESQVWILGRIAAWKYATRRKSGVKRLISVQGGWSIKKGDR